PGTIRGPRSALLEPDPNSKIHRTLNPEKADHDIDPPRRDVGEQLLQSRPIDRGAGEPAVIIARAQADPAFVPLAVDEGLTGLALRLQRIELLLEPLLGRFAGVDRTVHGSAPPRSGSWIFH